LILLSLLNSLQYGKNPAFPSYSRPFLHRSLIPNERYWLPKSFIWFWFQGFLPMVLEMSVFHIAILVAAALLLILAAVSDARTYRIPNKVCLAVLLLFPFFVITAPSAIEWEQHLMVFGFMLVSGFVMFMLNIAGAGDIKLLAVTGLWSGPHLVAVFLVTTAIAGGLLAVLMIVLTHFRNRQRREPVALAKVPIPYGVAISIGGLCILSLLSQPVLFPS